MKTCIIIHGGPLSLNEKSPHQLHTMYWLPWVKSELELKGIHTITPSMPNPWNCEYEEWKTEFEKYGVDEHSVLIGHSRGCAFLVRWLGETKVPTAKLIMVAPNFVTKSDSKSIQDFYNFKIDESIKERVGERIVFFSNTEDKDGTTSRNIITTKLDCRVIELPNHGHYITEEMGGDAFPELVEEVLKSI